MKKPLAVLGGILIALAPVIVLAATMYTLMLPNIYRSSVRISVTEDAPAIDPFVQGEDVAPYNPYFLRTQFEIIQSKPVLYEVVNRLDLQREWGTGGERLPREVAYKILRNSVQVSQMRDTSLIVISVSRDNPDEAAEIANELAVTYRDSRLDLALRDGRGAIEKVEEALKEQLKRVEAAEDKIQNLRVELDISVFQGTENPETNALRLQQLEKDRLMAEAEVLEKESLLKTLEKLKEKGLLEQAAYITFDPAIVKTLQQIQDVSIQLKAKEIEFGANHSDVKRFAVQKKDLEEWLEIRMKALRNGLQTECMLAGQKVERLDKVLEDWRTTTIDAQGEKYRPFRVAMAELETERFIYTQLEAKHRQEIITLEVPRNPVEIIDVATPNRRPVSPNLFMNVLLSVVVAGMCALSGGIMMAAGLRKSPLPIG